MIAPAPRAPIVTLTPNPALDLSTATDAVTPNHKLRCGPPRIDPGGGGINVSRVVRRLGSATTAVFVAGGSSGAQLVAALAEEGIETSSFEVPHRTRQSFSITESSTGDLFRFVLPGAPLSRPAEDGLLERFSDRIEPGMVGVGSGSLPGGIADDFWARAAQIAKAANAHFVLDSSVGVPAALEVGVSVLRLNHEELADFTGRELAWPNAVADWCAGLVADGKAKTVIVAHGADGALLANREGRVAVRPPHVAPTSAIGAGDSFVAGFCHGMATGLAPANALRLAVVSAAAALMTPGTDLARREDIDRLLAETPEPQALDQVAG